MGTGQFRPGDMANPNIGSVGTLEEVEEARVETLCDGEEVARKAVDALKRYVSSLQCCRALLVFCSLLNFDHLRLVYVFVHATKPF